MSEHNLTKQQTIRRISKATGISHKVVARMMETLIHIFSDQIVAGGRIEIQNFIILEVKTISFNTKTHGLLHQKQLRVKASQRLRDRIREAASES